MRERFEHFQERQIAILIGGFENVIEVTYWLMIVKNQAKMDFWIVHIASKKTRLVSNSIGQGDLIAHPIVVFLSDLEATFKSILLDHPKRNRRAAP